MKQNMRIVKKILTLVLFLSLALISARNLPTKAIQVPISLSEYDQFVRLNPGGRYEGAFTVTNGGEKSVEVEIQLRDFSKKIGGGDQLAPAGTMDNSLAKYITYNPDQTELAPGESREVNYSIQLPEGANRPHWAALVVKTKEPLQTSGNQSESETGFKVNLNVNHIFSLYQQPANPPERSGKISSIDVEGTTTEENKKNLIVNTLFKNTSESIERCTGYIEVRSGEGEKLLRYDFADETTVLPGSKRMFSHQFSDVDLGPGKYVILAVIDYGGGKMAGGQYIATVGKGEGK